MSLSLNKGLKEKLKKLKLDIKTGLEKPYWEIPQEDLIGHVWNFFGFHSYSYYMDRKVYPKDKWDEFDRRLKSASERNLFITLFLNGSTVLFGGLPSLLHAISTAIPFAELESRWAYYIQDGQSFGSSHTMATATGFILAKFFSMHQRKWYHWPIVAMAVWEMVQFFEWWQADKWFVTSNDPYNYPHDRYLHRTDHVAHIGGILVGFLSGYFLPTNKIFS